MFDPAKLRLVDRPAEGMDEEELLAALAAVRELRSWITEREALGRARLALLDARDEGARRV